ncbi:MAG TPA: chondroitinase-B domain-containing protein [Melioribacteraceae bacterium]|nr:chondroitinase-B domain-containing protein [Melioribacteraceae bacterium]
MKYLYQIFLILLAFSDLEAKKIFVSSAQQISAALSTVQPGDTLVMTKGIWNNQQIVFQANGTSSSRIYLIAEKDGEVILTGTSTLRIAGKYLEVSGLYFKDGYSSSGAVIEFRNGSSLLSNYCRLTNTAIVNYNPSDKSKDYKWISLYGTHNRVDHCYLKGKDHLGTTLVVWLGSTPNYHLIDNNYFAFRPAYTLPPYNGAETIRVGDSGTSMQDSYTTVEYNYFEQCNGETEIISNKSCENIYRYNTFKDCEGTLTLRHGNRCTVENNYFFCGNKPNSGGIRIIGEDHKVFNNYIEGSAGTSLKAAISIMNGVPNSPLNRYFQVKRAIVAFNTVVNSRNSIAIGAGKDSELSLPPLDCIIVNNIFYSTQSPIVTLTDNPLNMTWSKNIFFGTSIGMTLPSNNLNVSPLLSKGSDNIYRLLSGSPAINGSDPNYKYVTRDFEGQDRIEPNDIGADEFSNQEIKITPVGPHNTGPEFIRLVSSIKNNDEILPDKFVLEQNYPNPFNPETTITYKIISLTDVELKVYDLTGSEIATLVKGLYLPGIYSAKFSAVNYSLPSGVFFYKLTAGKFSETKKMVVLK